MKDQALYEYIWERLYKRGHTFEQISHSLQLGIAGGSMQKKYKRLCTKLSLPYRPPTIQEVLYKPNASSTTLPPKPLSTTEGGLQVANSENPASSTVSDTDIIRQRYGELPPTRYVSDLDIDDWISRYIKYDYGTDDPQEIAEAKERWKLPYISNLRKRVWEENELVVLLPRGYGKTESMLALFVRWFLEIRKPLYIVGISSSHNKAMLERMVMFIKSPMIRRDYGDVINKIGFDKELMSLTYDVTLDYNQFDRPLSIVTWTGAKEGVHPAWIHFEDVMQKDFKNIDSNDDIKRRYSNTFDKMRRGRGKNLTKVTITGTRYGLEDMYSYFIEVQRFPVLHLRALTKDNVYLYNPDISKERLMREREIDLATFETKRNNNPISSSGLYFKAESWRGYTDDLHHKQGIQYYIILDPARGTSSSSDNTAILVIAIYNGIAWICDGFIGKINDDEKQDKVDAYYRKYNPTHTVIEKIFAQIDMNRFNHLRGVIAYGDRTKGAKIARISAMRGYFTDFLIRVKEGIQPYDFLHQEYLSYNETESHGSRKDDSIDALSIFIQLFGKYLERYAEESIDWSKIESLHLATIVGNT